MDRSAKVGKRARTPSYSFLRGYSTCKQASDSRVTNPRKFLPSHFSPPPARCRYRSACAEGEDRGSAYANLDTTTSLEVSLPWVTQELKGTRLLMGDDYWRYGIRSNVKELQSVMRYTHEHLREPRPARHDRSP